MNVRLLRLFQTFNVVPRYLVKRGQRYQLQAVSTHGIPHAVVPIAFVKGKDDKDFVMGSNELARVVPRNELIQMKEVEDV